MSTGDLTCNLRFDDLDLADPAGCRTRLIDAVKGRDFERMIRGLSLAAAHVRQGPAPREVGGSAGVSVGGNIGGGGGINVGGHVDIHF